MIQDDAARAWAAATSVARDIAPYATKMAEQLDLREEAYAQYMRSVYDLHQAASPLFLAADKPHPARAQIRAAAAATGEAVVAVRQSLTDYMTTHNRLDETTRDLNRVLDGRVPPDLEPEQWTDVKQTDAFTRLAYQYWHADRPNDATNLTPEDFLDLGDELSARRYAFANAEYDQLNSDADVPGRVTTSTPEHLANQVLRQLERDYPPENPDRPTTIDKYVTASNLAHAIADRAHGYSAHMDPAGDSRSLDAIRSTAQAIAAGPRTLTAESSEQLWNNIADLGWRDPFEDGYPDLTEDPHIRLAASAAAAAAVEAPSTQDTAAATNAAGNTAVHEAQRLRSLSFPEAADVALQRAAEAPTSDLDHLTTARATRDAARRAAVPTLDTWDAEILF